MNVKENLLFKNTFLNNKNLSYDRNISSIDQGYIITYLSHCIIDNVEINIEGEADSTLDGLTVFCPCVSVNYRKENIFDFSLTFSNINNYIEKGKEYIDFENLENDQLKAIGYSQIMIKELFEDATLVFHKLDSLDS